MIQHAADINPQTPGGRLVAHPNRRSPLMRMISAMLATLLASPLAAQMAIPCDWQTRGDAIVEPWESNIATFANGEVQVAHLDTIEPAAGSAYLLILHPPYDALGVRQCTTIGRTDNLGYAAIFFDEIVAGYDPAKGLTLQVPTIIYLPEEGFQNSALLKITVNQSSGDVTVTQALAE